MTEDMVGEFEAQQLRVREDLRKGVPQQANKYLVLRCQVSSQVILL